VVLVIPISHPYYKHPLVQAVDGECRLRLCRLSRGREYVAMTAIAAKSASRLGDALEVGASAEIDARYDSSRTKVNPKPVGKQAMITFTLMPR
jgi:hypothetical protein